MAKKTIPRHFPYQHPTFGTAKRPKPAFAWEGSVYYWWWAYLKRNREYLACCESGGAGKLSKHYKDFGDVRGGSFKAWWSENDRGARLFAEPKAEDSVRVLEEGEKAASRSQALTLSLPLNLPKKFLIERCRELLADVRKGGVGKLYARASDAAYKVTGQPNLVALKRALMVYDAIEASKGMKPKKPYWKIATELDLVDEEDKVQPTDSLLVAENKRNVMKAIVGRLKKRAEVLIEQSASQNFIGTKSSASEV
jgi:hypothetical protein